MALNEMDRLLLSVRRARVEYALAYLEEHENSPREAQALERFRRAVGDLVALGERFSRRDDG